MLRALAYLVIGWLLVVLVGGLAEVLHLTVMLPAVSAVVIAHLAFARQQPLALGLGVALALGYIEDLHQGAPVGTLALAYCLAFIALTWVSGRLHLRGLPLRIAASLAACVVIDILTFGILMLMADAFELRREALWISLWDTRWHALATMLAGSPIWDLIDFLLYRLKLDGDTGERRPGALGGR